MKNGIFFIEALAKPNSYTEHQSSIHNYNFKNNEPNLLEYRISSTSHWEFLDESVIEENIETVSLLFVKKKLWIICMIIQNNLYLNII